jgi:Porin subfamily
MKEMRMYMTRAGLIGSAAVAVLLVAGAEAQTLSNPQPGLRSPDPKWATPPSTTRAPSPRRTKSCSQYGAGFIYVPAADTCVKAGGAVELDIKSR